MQLQEPQVSDRPGISPKLILLTLCLWQKNPSFRKNSLCSLIGLILIHSSPELILKIHKLSNLMENLFVPMICTSYLLKDISGMQFSMQIWTRESQAACLAHEKQVQIVGNSKIYFTILIYFYHHIVALRCVAARACAKQAAWDSQV